MGIIFSKILLIVGVILNPIEKPEPPTTEAPPLLEEIKLDVPATKVDVPLEEATNLAHSEVIELGGATTTEEIPRCSCVAFVRKISNFKPPRVASAKDLPVNRAFPLIGSWMIFKAGGVYGRDGHVALVVGQRPGETQIVEYNLIPCEEGRRWIKNDDPAIKGFYDERQ